MRLGSRQLWLITALTCLKWMSFTEIFSINQTEIPNLWLFRNASSNLKLAVLILRLLSDESWQRENQEAHECLHGIFTLWKEEDNWGPARYPQCGDLQEARQAVEGAEWEWEAALHPGGWEAPPAAPAGVPGLQIPTQEETESDPAQVFHWQGTWEQGSQQQPHQKVCQTWETNLPTTRKIRRKFLCQLPTEI